MKCEGVYKYICENLDANMKSARCRAIKKHIDSCPDCSAYLDSLKKTIMLYKKESGPSVPIHMHRQLFKMIDVAIAETAPRDKTRAAHPKRRKAS
ncbi:MAG: hypothetical protein HY961_20575 [Ignavibacteriae bacterium]|nr:hypothetical protein [Ignavibacteriota bacterium]